MDDFQNTSTVHVLPATQTVVRDQETGSNRVALVLRHWRLFRRKEFSFEESLVKDTASE